MITKLNLSSRPFRNRTLPYLIALLLLAFSVAGALLCFSEIRDAADKSEIARKQYQEMAEEVEDLRTKGEQVQQQLTPEQRSLLIASHKLVANKAFGWSRLFADLESVLPGGVSVSRINVENVYKTADGKTQAELEFAVLSRDYQSVMTMIDSMNSSGNFQAELRGQDLQKGDTITYTEYTLYIKYTQRNSYAPSAPTTDIAREQGGDQ